MGEEGMRRAPLFVNKLDLNAVSPALKSRLVAKTELCREEAFCLLPAETGGRFGVWSSMDCSYVRPT